MTIYNIKNHATGEEKKCIRLDTVYNEIEKISDSAGQARWVERWAEKATPGKTKTSERYGYTVAVTESKEEKING